MIRHYLVTLMLTLFMTNESSAGAYDTEQLAIESYKHLVNSEMRLSSLLRGGKPETYRQGIRQTTLALMHRWPGMASMQTTEYATCYFMLEEFRIYADSLFPGETGTSRGSHGPNEYIELKGACKSALKGKL